LSDRAELLDRLDAVAERFPEDELKWRAKATKIPFNIEPVATEEERILLDQLAREDRALVPEKFAAPFRNAVDFVDAHCYQRITSIYNAKYLAAATVLDGCVEAEKLTYETMADGRKHAVRTPCHLNPTKMTMKDVKHVRLFLHSQGEARVTASLMSMSSEERAQIRTQREATLTLPIYSADQPAPRLALVEACGTSIGNTLVQDRRLKAPRRSSTTTSLIVAPVAPGTSALVAYPTGLALYAFDIPV